MFNNIFKKKVLRKKSEKKITIYADIHEKNSLIISELTIPSITCEIKPLKIGDYLINDIVIERKTVSDLISSMINKRLLQQLKQMEKYNKRLLIIEGNLNEIENKNMLNAVRGLITSICLNSNTPVIITENYNESAQYLITIAKQQLKPKSEISFHSRIPKSLYEQKKYVLESFPHIGPKKANKLIEKFSNLFSVFNASSDELEPILKSQTKEFKNILEN